MATAPPSANDMLTGSGTSDAAPERARRLDRADLELMKIMWERVGWDPPNPEITDIERNPGGRTETDKRRPRVVPPGRDTALLYYSPTNTAKLPSNQFNLERWKQRQVLKGTALDPGIQDLAISHQDDDDFLNDLVFRAMRRAKSDQGADQGTARHKLAEKIDFGIDPGPLSPRMRADIEAYRGATRGLRMVLGEMIVVDDANKMCGTFDRVIEYQGRYYIGDLKPPDTGYGQDEHAIQFAIYSRALLYNWNLAQQMLAAKAKAALKTTNLRAELPGPIDQDRAIVIHVPRDGIGRASVAWVDIRAGWDGFEHAKWMRRWQSRDFREALETPFEPKVPATVIDTAAGRATDTAASASNGNGHIGKAAQRALDAAPTAADDAPLDAPLDDPGAPSDEDVALAEILGATDDTALKVIYAKHRALWTSPEAAVPTAWRDKRAELTRAEATTT